MIHTTSEVMQKKSTDEAELLVLLDGHAMVHRAFHAIQNPLTLRRTGEEVRGVYGFTQMLLKAIDTLKPTHLILTFDMPGPTFRHDMFDEYKAQRLSMSSELAGQFPHIRRLLEAFHIPIFELDKYEADDLLGTLSAQASDKEVDAVIITGDTDTLQLVGPRVRVLLQYSTQKQTFYGEPEVSERYGGLTPRQVIDLKALCGDTSDNIPGIPSVGPKTAIKLLLQYDSVQGIYDHLDELPAKQQALFEEHRERVFQGLTLVTIVRDAPVELNMDDSKWGQYDRAEVVEVLKDLEFFSTINKIPNGTGGGEPDSSLQPSLMPAPAGDSMGTDYKTVSDAKALEAMVKELAASKGFAFDTETMPLDEDVKGVQPLRSGLVGLSFSTEKGKAWYVPVGHAEGPQLSWEQVLEKLRPVLEDPDVPKAAHNANYDLTMMGTNGVTIKGLAFDTMLAAHLLGHKAIGLKSMSLDLLGIEMTPIADLIGSGRKMTTMNQVSIEQVSPYASADADMTYRLWIILEERLKTEGLLELFTKVEVLLTPIIVQMQITGIALDVGLMETMAVSLGERLGKLEQDSYDSLGHTFNLGSPKQLGEVLFDELKLGEMAGIGKPKKTKTGGYSTDAAALDSLSGVHPLVDMVLEHRQLSKLKSTYVDALPSLVNPRTGKLHTTYNQAGSVTGRFSSNDPNLQNIPIRTDLGRQIRVAFHPCEEGWLLLAADYSQIELRVLAHLSEDPGLLEAFRNDQDIHAATASQIYGVELDRVTADMRRNAKVLNFGIIYGLSAFGIAQQTELSMEEGRDFIEGYLGRYPKVKDYIENTKQMARDQGYVQTLLGRRRYTPEITSGNPQIRQATEREAINMPVQGTAAEALKLAMLGIDRRMTEEGFKSNLLLQVHDELIFETPPDEIEDLKSLLLDVMPRAMELAPTPVEFAVPLKVATKAGSNWGELE
ncbi:MAG: DNA polymerase I [Chloroflexota bacterium]|nr:DNA polymerase I [Chloroflexota bacterium]